MTLLRCVPVVGAGLVLTDASENLAGWVENRPGQVEFCIGYLKDGPVRASDKKFLFASLGRSKETW